ncbi:MAG: carbohydrate ABC transporter permease [Desulfurococcaceae archaeon]
MKKLTFIYIIITLIIAVTYIFPLYWLIATSLKSYIEIYSNPPYWYPPNPSIQYYLDALYKFFGLKYLANSLIVAAVNAGLATVISLLAAYTISRFKFKGRDTLFFSFVSMRMAPPVVFAVAYYYMFCVTLGMKDQLLSLIIVYLVFNVPIAIWLLLSAEEAIPRDLDYAAKLEGYGPISTLFKIHVPIIKGVIAISYILTFLFAFNEYLFASFLTSTEARTIPTALQGMVTVAGVYWSQMAALGVISAIPGIVIALITRKYLVTGLTMGMA